METQTNVSKNKLSASFFFLSLGLIITLITSVTSWLTLFFQTLDNKFPDVLNANYQYGYQTYNFEGMRMALATLIIFFPIFLIVSYYWKKKDNIGLLGADAVLKKWLIYIILFVSSLVAVIDLVTLVRYFVSGEITLRFIFKVLAVLLVVLFVGVYYIFVLQGRKKFRGFFSVGPWSAIKSVIWVALVVWFAFSVMGSPFKQRLLQLDQRRLNDLQNIQSQVIYYWQQKQSLPAQLSDLVSPLTGYSLPVDPEFEQGKTYEYSVKDAKALKFELCADFDLPMPKGWVENPSYGGGVAVPMAGSPDVISYPYPGPGGTNESWDHQAGRTCYERTIDKDLYPPYPKPAAQ